MSVKSFEGMKFKSESVRIDLLMKVVGDALVRKEGRSEHRITDPDGDVKIGVTIRRNLILDKSSADMVVDNFRLEPLWKRITYIFVDDSNEVVFDDSWTKAVFYFYIVA